MSRGHRLQMKILLFGVLGRRSLGYAIRERLLARGHFVTPLAGSPQDIKSLTKQDLASADAVIDAQLPDPSESRKTGLPLRPMQLQTMLKGSGKTLIMTSSVVVLGDTGPIPVDEGMSPHAPRKFAWLAELEGEIQSTSDLRGVVIRPAMEHYRSLSVAMGNCITLALRFKEGKYIGDGMNCWSAVHPDDLADLYCLALDKAEKGMLVHASSETFSMKQLASVIHFGLGLKGEPSSMSLEEAKRFSPIAENLTRNSAISSDLAKRTLGWRPSRDSILKLVENQAYVSRHEIGRVPAPCFKPTAGS